MEKTFKIDTTPKGYMFSNKDLIVLLVPIIAEQILNILMGMIDTIMVSNVGSAAISAVSMVDTFNQMIVMVIGAVATGGAICCGHHVGSRNMKAAENSAKQLLFIMLVLSGAITLVCMVTRIPLLNMLFGSVEPEVMRGAQEYFLYTLISFPFFGVYSAASAVFRASGNSKLPFKISVTSNVLNIIGNAWCIWGLGMGVKGAAVATLGSRVFLAVVIMIFLRRPVYKVTVKNYFAIRPDVREIKRILFLGIPNGIENSTFQMGKLVIQSTIAVLPTYQLAALAMTNTLEMLNGIAGIGVGMGMMTVISQCLGAGEKEQAMYYIRKLARIGTIVVAISCYIVLAGTWPTVYFGGMEPDSARLCIHMMIIITIIKPFNWAWSFIPAYGLRSAGDVKFAMITSISTMWLVRVTVSIICVKFVGMGVMAVWMGMFADWTVRALIFHHRVESRKWLTYDVL